MTVDHATICTALAPPPLAEFSHVINEAFPDVRVTGYVGSSGRHLAVDLDTPAEWPHSANIGLEERHGDEPVLTSIAVSVIRGDPEFMAGDALTGGLPYYLTVDRENIPEPWLPRIERVLLAARCRISIAFPAGDAYHHDLRRRIVWVLDRWLGERCDGILYDGHGIVDPVTRELVWSV